MRMLRAGVPVALGVDGSSSNDSGHLLAEARQALLLQRLREGAEHCAVRDMLRVATRGGARVLGRQDTWASCAWASRPTAPPLRSTISGTPALCTIPLPACCLCHSTEASYTIVAGEVLVEEGRLTRFDPLPLLARHREHGAAPRSRRIPGTLKSAGAPTRRGARGDPACH
jgi:8-oxoguanine deaminase